MFVDKCCFLILASLLAGLISQKFAVGDEQRPILTFLSPAPGFKVDELKASIEGDQLVIKGAHTDANDASKYYVLNNRVSIPPGFKPAVCTITLDDNGQLSLRAELEPGTPQQGETFPIVYKQQVRVAKK